MQSIHALSTDYQAIIITMVSRRPTRAARASRSSAAPRRSVDDVGSPGAAPIRRSDGPASKWMAIPRRPAPGIGFLVETWVRVDQLTW